MDDKAAKDYSVVLPMIEFVQQTHELEDDMKKVTHHNFVAVLKEVSYNVCENPVNTQLYLNT